MIESPSASSSLVTKTKTVIALMVILALALTLRLAHLSERGLWYWDEGIFVMGARFTAWRVTEGWDVSPTNVSDYPGFPTFIGKPGFVAILTLWGWLRGEHSESGGIEVSVILSLATIVLVYRMGSLMLGPSAGLLAGLLLTLSTYYLTYSRSGLHEIASGFFLLASISVISPVHQRTGVWRFVISGLLMGICLGCSYRLLMFAPLAWMIRALDLVARDRRQWKTGLVHAVGYWGGFALPLLLIEVQYRVLIGSVFEQFEVSSYGTFLRDKFALEGYWDTKNLLFYPTMLTTIDGLPLVLLFGMGLVYLLVRRRLAEQYLLFIIVAPALMLSLSSTRLTRAVSALIPLLCVSAGLYCAYCIALMGRARFTATILIVTPLIGISLLKGMQLSTVSSGYSKAFEVLKAENQGHFSTMMPLSMLAFDKQQGFYPPAELAELAAAAQRFKIRYLLVDWQKYLWYHDSIRFIEEQYDPHYVVHNAHIDYPGVLGENYLPDDVTKLPVVDPTISWIKIYDLAVVFPELQRD